MTVRGFEASLAAQPRHVIFLVEKHRHPVVHFFIRLNWVPRLRQQPGLEGSNSFVGNGAILSAQKLVFCDQKTSNFK
jgi:hypothetical protein